MWLEINDTKIFIQTVPGQLDMWLEINDTKIFIQTVPGQLDMWLEINDTKIFIQSVPGQLDMWLEINDTKIFIQTVPGQVYYARGRGDVFQKTFIITNIFVILHATRIITVKLVYKVTWNFLVFFSTFISTKNKDCFFSN